MIKAGAAWLFFLVLNCAGQSSANFKEELRSASKATGLALVLPGTGNRLLVFPFDGKPQSLEPPPGRSLHVTVGKGGKMILWWGQPLLGQIMAGQSPTPDGVVTDVDGRRVIEFKIPSRVLRFSPEALSEVSRRLAFEGTVVERGVPTTGSYWGTLDFSTIGFMAPIDGPSSFDWSPDGRYLAFDRKHQIYVFDTETGKTSSVVAGSDPSWSPEGRGIAFLASDNRASFTTKEGAPLSWSLSGYKPNGPIRWSPDGKYVAFSQPVPNDSPLGISNRTTVVRVTDGAAMTAAEFGPFWPNYTGYRWILGYRTFCPECKPK